METNARFGELRSIVQQRPSAQAWEALCEHLEGWPSPEQELLAIPYAEQHVARWPSSILIAPLRWLKRLTPYEPLRLARTMSILDTPITLELASSLANNPHLRHIERIYLRSNQLGDQGLATLLGGSHFLGLTSLSVHLNSLRAFGAQVLAERAYAGQLQELSLYGNRLRDQGVRQLAQGPLHRLKRLDLCANEVKDEGAKALAQHTTLHALNSLDLRRNQISDVGVEVLAGSARMSALRALYMEDNPFTTRGEQALATSEHLRQNIRDQWART
jgi:hypothetical protein